MFQSQEMSALLYDHIVSAKTLFYIIVFIRALQSSAVHVMDECALTIGRGHV